MVNVRFLLLFILVFAEEIKALKQLIRIYLGKLHLE